MDFWDILALVGGLCLFLFGMNLMGSYLEKAAGGGLKTILGKLTTGKMAGFLTGLGVTAVIQSSSATTVMVVGFVNSGLLTLRQAINVIMGANVGTTVTAWLLSLTGIDGGAWFVEIFKPSSFTPILALIGVILFMGSKSNRKKDIGVILLGFATLMHGMDAMSVAVTGLKTDPNFTSILTLFDNPILGILTGALLTAVVQSSSASVGILQALSSTGKISIGMSIPIIMGQNIGTCVTALISSVGTNRNARRASIVHLSFNVIGTAVFISLFSIIRAVVDIPLLTQGADQFTIAICHSVFNIGCTALMLPCAGLLEKLSMKLIPEPKGADQKEEVNELDERLMITPAVAIERCRVVTEKMASISKASLYKALDQLNTYDEDICKEIIEEENKVDEYEDILGSYLVKLNTFPLTDRDMRESAKLLHLIGDIERISDHAVNVMESAEELNEKGIVFSDFALGELSVIISAVKEIVELSYTAFVGNDIAAAKRVEPLEQVIDNLKEKLRTRHIERLQNGGCTIEAGFIWSDLLNNLERVSDHCSNVAGCVIEMAQGSLDLHQYLKSLKDGKGEFVEQLEEYSKVYSV
ncbi:MAG: Na/Pi cotransporter family protein [Clostridia bacterium]|nr:Na/Pi cotransporter family protein [Clostridia bacterium]